MRTTVPALCLALALAGCSSKPDRPRTPPSGPTPTFRLAVITDLQGTLEPCGCTSRPLGGIDRLAARLKTEETAASLLFVAAGDLLFDTTPPTLEGAEAQETWKASTVVEILATLGLAAATPGAIDFGGDPARFVQVARGASFPWLAAGRMAPAGSGSLLRAGTTVRLGETTVGILGVSEVGAPIDDASGDVLAGAAREAARLRAEGARAIVALVRGDRRLARRVAAIDGVRVVVLGGLDQADPVAPFPAGGAIVVHAGRQGQGVVLADVYLRADGALEDKSPWTARVERERLAAEAASLRLRIEEWERARDVDPADLARQRARLDELEAEALRVVAEPPIGSGNAFVARYEELAPEHARDADTGAIVDAYDRRVNAHNRQVFARLLPPPAPEGTAHYVGSPACASCHAPAFAWWQGHLHGHAYRTLQDRHKEFNLDCVGCHVTGYMQPGGSTVTHLLDGSLANVGCESCHGPGSIHVERDGAKDAIVLDPGEARCIGCHNQEHSDLFQYAMYRERLIAPGHGR